MFWEPAYRLNGIIRIATGIASISTVYALYKITPFVVTLRTSKQLEEEIEQRKKAEKIAQTEIEENKRIMEASVDIICTINQDGRFVRVSKAAERILGYADAELVGAKYIDFVHPEDLEATYKCHESLFTGNAVNEFVNRYKRKDGKWVYISWNCSLSLDKALSYCVARDISHRIKNEQFKEQLNRQLLEKIKLLKEQDQTLEKIKEFKFLADSIPQIVWTSRPDGFLDYYNQHWIEYTGMSIEETQGWGWEPVLHPDDLENCVKVWTESLTTGAPYEVEYRFKRASDGAYRWHLGRALPMRNDQGEIVKWFGSCTDIDEYKRALDLEVRISQFEDFNRIVAHNLRGPSGSIGTLIDMLPDAETEDDRNDFIQMLRESSASLNETLNELMKVLEVRFNKNIPFDTCDLKEITNSVESMLKGQMITKKATVNMDFEKPQIKFPHIYLESIFYNMISNSLKYTKENVPPVIDISSRIEYGKTVLTFKDNGLGVDLEEHGQNMFKLNKVFHRGFDSKGVGLFMTKTQIETFGGSIKVESEVGLGTIFTITL